MSQIQRIIARNGVAANVPTLLAGEIAYDTDTKTFRVGDDTSTPPRLLSTKSTGVFDFSTATSVKFKEVLISAAGKVDGLTLNTMNTAPGFVVRKGSSGQFGNVTFGCSDATLVVTNGDGQSGNVDIKLHPDVVSILTGQTYLTQVVHDSSLTGTGAQGNALAVVNSSTSVKGIIQIADQTVANLGVATDRVLTPGALAALGAASDAMVSFRTNFMNGFSINKDTTLSGNGGTSALSVVAASESQRGAAEIATQTEANGGTDDTRIVTAAKLAAISEAGLVGQRIKAIGQSKVAGTHTSLPTNGSTQTLLTTFTDFTIHLEVVADATQGADAFYTATTEVTVQFNIAGSWQTVMYAEAKDTGGAATGSNVPFHDSKQYIAGRILHSADASSPRIVGPLGLFLGAWNGQVKVITNLAGTGLAGGLPVGNAGTSVARVVYS